MMIEIKFFIVVEPNDPGTHLTTARVCAVPDVGEMITVGGFPYAVLGREWTLGHDSGKDTMSVVLKIRTLYERM